jgi:hypothetical protein
VKPTANAAMMRPATTKAIGVPMPLPITSITGMIPTTMTSGAFQAMTLKNNWKTPRLPRSRGSGSPVIGAADVVGLIPSWLVVLTLGPPAK